MPCKPCPPVHNSTGQLVTAALLQEQQPCGEQAAPPKERREGYYGHREMCSEHAASAQEAANGAVLAWQTGPGVREDPESSAGAGSPRRQASRHRQEGAGKLSLPLGFCS